MISIVVTSWKEPNTIGKCIRSLGNTKYSGLDKEFEIIQLSPDRETLEAGLKAARSLNLSNSEYIQIQDPKKGKPFALTLALKKAKGDILILTDGDTYFGRDAVKKLLVPFNDKKVGGVSGRPVSMDKKDNIFGYWGHLLSDAAHHKRISTINVKRETYYTSGNTFFPMSGYIMAMRKYDIHIPGDILSDDAYISYTIRKRGMQIAYAPEALCYVKYPTNLKDYYKQKVRSLGGFLQLESIGVIDREHQSRSLSNELKYTLFVLKYATSFKELLWSLLLFPVRLYTWIRIYWDRKIIKKEFNKTWVRVESTK